MFVPKIVQFMHVCALHVCVCVCSNLALLFSHLGILTSSESTAARLAGTAGQLHNYHSPQTTFDVVPQTTMPSLPSSLAAARRVLITKAITICIQTTVSQTVGKNSDESWVKFWRGLSLVEHRRGVSSRDTES